MRLIAIVTDFGLQDPFVAAMKGCHILSQPLRPYHRYFSCGQTAESPLAIFGSLGYLELSVNNGSAERFFRARKQQVVTIEFGL